MPIFKLTDKAGRSYKVTAPDADTAYREFSAAMGGGEGATATEDATASDPLLNPQLGREMLDAIDGNATENVPDGVADVGKAIPSGLLRGTAAIAGTPGLIKDVADFALRTAGGYSKEEQQKRRQGSPGGDFIDGSTPTAHGAQAAIESAVGPLYVPHTAPGRYAGAIAEFAPSALAGSGSALQRATQVVLPAVGSETLGHYTQGSPLEPYARVAGAFLGAGVGAFGHAAGSGSGVLGGAMEGITNTELQAAQALRQRSLNQGIDLTLDEALNTVTNGRAQRLSQVSRVVANSGGEGGQIMNDVYARRPGQVDAAGRSAFDAVEPRPMDPYVAGPEIQRHAEGAIDRVRDQINDVSRPLYDAANPHAVPFDPASRGASSAAAWEQGLQAVRNDPILGPGLAHFPDNSVAVIDAVSKRLRDLGEAASTNPQALNRQAGGVMQSTSGAARDAARQAVPEYDQALAMQEAGRRYELAPAEHGPLGELKATPDIRAQAEGVFPTNPAANSETAVRDAFAGMSAEDQRLAGSLLRQHLEGNFNKATGRLQDGGQNIMGGANFAKAVATNPQQERNLMAALEAGAGPQAAERVSLLIEALRATGRKPQKGSDTAFNAHMMEEMKHGTGMAAQVTAGAAGGAAAGGGVAGLGGAAGGAVLGAKNAFADALMRYRLGNHTAEAARILTDPHVTPAELRRMGARSRQNALAGLLRTGALGEIAYDGAQPVP